MKFDIKKKKYLTPEVTQINIDQEISLVMMTEPPDGPPAPEYDSGSKGGGKSSPFGGESPDYGKM